MELRDLQSALNARGWTPPLALDGDWGGKTETAIDALLTEAGVKGFTAWAPARKELAAKQVVMKLQGIETGAIDGLAGPQTRYALQVWDARLRGHKEVETWRDSEPVPPKVADGVWPRQSGVPAFYGNVGADQVKLALPYPLRIAWDKGQTVKSISLHRKVADSAGRVLARVLDHYGMDEIRNLGLDLFGGSLNVRKMRGGSSYSMHSWGIAIDFDPERNQLEWGRERARLARPDAEAFWKFWEAEGWLSLGRARNYDWMHVQAARL
ncbi:MAG: hypothetical protein K0S00_3402 [Xanthobacteraceae bacterium]|jgi:hypothetical protein|nr:hypothetical protein [Xanthobacteraceae bacterium]